MLITRKIRRWPSIAITRRFSGTADSSFNVFAKMSDGVGVPSNTGEAAGKKRPPSKRVLELVDQVLNLSLIEAADLCDICQERLSERSGGIPLRTPFVHPGSMFGMVGSPMMQAATQAGSGPTTSPPQETASKQSEEAAVVAAAPAEAEKSIVTVKLVSYAADKRVGVIKEIRSILGLGLKESKELVESVPKIIKRGLPREEGEQLKAKIEAAGGVVEFS